MKHYIENVNLIDFKNNVTFLPQFSLPQSLLIAGLTSLSIVVGATANANPGGEASSQPIASATTLGKVHVYGQVPRPNALRTGYVVFQEIDDQVIGGYYQPYSEFSCFVGDLDNRELDVSFISLQGKELTEAQISLTDLHPLESPGATDQKVIRACRQQMSQSF